MRLEQVNKIYPSQTHAVKDFSLSLPPRQLTVLVGPSGCGKTTLLRMIAGLEPLTAGTIVNDEDEAAEQRVTMVFQQVALFDHLTVRQNMELGLAKLKIPADEIDRRVQEMAELLGLKGELSRKARALSGGQQQRVALGRALIRKAAVVLMDEPLSHLDGPLRLQLRKEIVAYQRHFQATMLYVTHDVNEALAMADNLVVMNAGQLVQQGDPRTVYQQPDTLFAGSFLGPLNQLPGIIADHELVTATTRFPLPEFALPALHAYQDQKVVAAFRPDALTDGAGWPVTLQVQACEFTGEQVKVQGQAEDCDWILAAKEAPSDAAMAIIIDPQKLLFYDILQNRIR